MNYVLIFLLGILSAAAYPTLYLWLTLFLALPMLFLSILRAKSGIEAWLLGFLFGFGFFAAFLHWALIPFFIYEITSDKLMLFYFLFFPIIFAIELAFAMYLVWRFPSQGLAKLIWYSICWVGFMWFSSRIFPHVPIAILGYTWGYSEAISQITAYIGLYGLSYLTVLICTTPAVFFMRATETQRWSFVAIMLTLATGIYLTGYLRLNNTETKYISHSLIRLVQSNVPSDASAEEGITQLLKLSRNPLPQTKLIIWPESGIRRSLIQGIDTDLNQTLPYIAKTSRYHFIEDIAKLLPEDGVLITGINIGALDSKVTERKHIYDDNDMAYTSGALIALNEKQQILLQYQKKMLMPFAEYNPMPWLFNTPAILNLIKSYKLELDDITIAGKNRPTLKLAALPSFVPLICYEAIFPGEAIESGQPRPNWLLIISNDIFQKNSIALKQHFETLKFRAIENGLPVVRASNGGITAVLDPYGRILQQIPENEIGAIDTLLPAAIPATLYAQYGDFMLFIIILISLILVWLISKKSVDHRSHDKN